jgi:hypothetical protein
MRQRLGAIRVRMMMIAPALECVNDCSHTSAPRKYLPVTPSASNPSLRRAAHCCHDHPTHTHTRYTRARPQACILRNCGHAFCSACLSGVVAQAQSGHGGGGARCPLCRTDFSQHDVVTSAELRKAAEAAEAKVTAP